MKTAIEKQKEAFTALKDEFSYENVMEAPKVEKVVVTSGIGSVTDKEKIEVVRDRLAKITGQKPVPSKAKKSIASFNVRAGDVVGYKVTLRGKRSYGFLDKLIHVVFPRTKDFRGISPDSIDEMGNISIGIPEHTAFPEASDEELKDVFGLEVTIVTSHPSAKEAEALLRHLGLPLKEAEGEASEGA